VLFRSDLPVEALPDVAAEVAPEAAAEQPAAG
jgi:hypothetical protein